MNIDAIIQELIKDSFRISNIDEICQISGKSRETLFNELALELANRFQKGTLSYEDADGAMNLVWSFMVKDATEQGEGFSFAQPAFEIYEAFDEGEYDHRDGSDPVEKYTKPHIKEILSRA